MIITIAYDADLALFQDRADDCAPFEYDLMIDGLDAEVREVQIPGSNGIASGAIFLDGGATPEAVEQIEALEWVEAFGRQTPEEIAREWAQEIFEQMSEDDVLNFEDNRKEWRSGVSTMVWPELLHLADDSLDVVMSNLDELTQTARDLM